MAVIGENRGSSRISRDPFKFSFRPVNRDVVSAVERYIDTYCERVRAHLQSGLAEYFLYNVAYFSFYRYNTARISNNEYLLQR